MLFSHFNLSVSFSVFLFFFPLLPCGFPEDLSFFSVQSIFRKILVLNGICLGCNKTDFNAVYNNLFEAFQQEFSQCILNINSTIEILLQDGTHYLLRKDLTNPEAEIFRNCFGKIYIHPKNFSAIIMIKTNEFYFFVKLLKKTILK